MKRKKFLVALSAVVLSVAGYVGYQCALKTIESDLFMANVEALSEGERPIIMLQCTRGVKGANCVKQGRYGKEWVCAIFTEVENYEIPSTSPIECKHDVVG